MRPIPLCPGETTDASLALVLTGGGARAAYQVGVLRHIASHYPDLAPGIFTGVSAGGMIAMHLASRQERFASSVDQLTQIWRNLRTADVCGVNSVDLASWFAKLGRRLFTRGTCEAAPRRSLVDTEPLRRLLTNGLGASRGGSFDSVTRNLESGAVHAVGITASSYLTGQSTTWVQSRGRFGALVGESAREEPTSGSLCVDHVMASGALPFVFPPVEIDGTWYGDGGMRLTAPLSPAIKLGASKIIAVSTRYTRSPEEGVRPEPCAHPQPSQVAGTLLNAIFLDLLDADARRVRKFNELIARMPASARGDLRHVDVLVLRPTQDLGRLANQFEADLPRAFRFLLRRLGRGEMRSNDMLSLLMFQGDYMARLIELGEANARARASDIAAFLQPRPCRDDHVPILIAKPAGSASRFGQSRRHSYHDTSIVPVLAG